MNRDLSRRVRTVSGVTSHKQVVRADIKLAAKIIQNLDSRYQLWPDPDAEQKGQQVGVSAPFTGTASWRSVGGKCRESTKFNVSSRLFAYIGA